MRPSSGPAGPALFRAAVPAAAVLLAGCAASSGPAPAEPSERATAGEDGGWVRAVAPFPVLDEEGRPYDLPFLGGLDVPRPQFVDIDDDGDLDLFVQERSNEIMFLENVGTPSEARFVWRTDKYAGLDVAEWNRVVDVDRDGDHDVLAEERFSYVRVYENVGTPAEARFQQVADSLRDASGQAVFSDRQNIPALLDLDCNGMQDLFLGRVDGTVTRYEAVGGSGPVPRFRKLTDRFEGIEIVAQIGGQPVGASMRHGANSMAFADVDGDGDLDFFWGDFFEPGVLFVRNAGTCERPDLTDEPRPIMPQGDSLATSGYNVPYLADIDADGDLDLFVGVLGGAFNPNRTASDNFLMVERVGDDWAVRTWRYLNGIDVGSETVPALVDWDGDGDLDLAVGPRLDPARLNRSSLFLFENRGDARAPRWALADTLDLADTYHYAPAFGDLDGDGVPDLLLGTWNQGLRLFMGRRGGSGVPRWEPVGDSAVVTLTRGSHATPTLGDLDGDGDLDLIVGEASGALNHYRNEGSPAAPRFRLVTDELGGFDVGRRSIPRLHDVDGDGDLDLVVGNEDGPARLYRNDGGPATPAFVDAGTLPAPLLPYSAPTFGDVDGDGDADLVAGTLGGGLVFFEKR